MADEVKACPVPHCARPWPHAGKHRIVYDRDGRPEPGYLVEPQFFFAMTPNWEWPGSARKLVADLADAGLAKKKLGE